MTEQEEKKLRSEARKGVDAVYRAFVMEERRRYQEARMKICNRGIHRK